ncbi:hypothetical protein O6H91_06G013800 [Diphasiastrum complanatum]|uniref:Uncharacterized protein n=3 Tax=Diphasiastrum complanatum TaxID=34168 RepID=A0ACC2DBA7_DIPCM|nr:hypothetical protein O6H91_06G013800 [Diphasiastrum complanatum]KAJ7551405.1 hypothetical protein O6H91_06G013800 [Diphasiastrum complanatum]
MCLLDKSNVKSEPDVIASSTDSNLDFEAQSSARSLCPTGGMELALSEDQTSVKSEDLASPRLKFLCSYGGKILPRPHDNQLRYAGGETRVLVVNRNILFKNLIEKLRKLAEMDVCLRYKLPHEDLDSLVSVVSDEDLQNMMDEYEKVDPWDCSCRIRLFLFPLQQQAARCNLCEDAADARNPEQRFLDAVNSVALITRKQQAELPLRRLQQVPHVSCDMHTVAVSPVPFSASTGLQAIQPAVSDPIAVVCAPPTAPQTRSIPITNPTEQQQHGAPVLEMPKVNISKGKPVFQVSCRGKPDGSSRFHKALSGSLRAAAPPNVLTAADAENNSVEQCDVVSLEFDAASPRLRPFQDQVGEALSMKRRPCSNGKPGSELLDAEISQTERLKHVMIHHKPRQQLQVQNGAWLSRAHREAELYDHYKLDKSSSGSSSASSYEFRREQLMSPELEPDRKMPQALEKRYQEQSTPKADLWHGHESSQALSGNETSKFPCQFEPTPTLLLHHQQLLQPHSAFSHVHDDPFREALNQQQCNSSFAARNAGFPGKPLTPQVAAVSGIAPVISPEHSKLLISQALSHEIASHPVQTHRRILPPPTYDDQMYKANGLCRDQTSCSISGISYHSNFRGTGHSRFGDQPAQFDENLMRQRTSTQPFWKDEKVMEPTIYKPYAAQAHKGKSHASSIPYEGGVTCEDDYGFHQDMSVLYPQQQGSKQQLVMLY